MPKPSNSGESSKVVKALDRFRVQLAKDVQDHLLGMAPRALKVKHDILKDPEESIWLKDRVATYVIDKIVPNPSQQISIKGAIVSAQYTDEELKQVLLDRILFASSLLGQEGPSPGSDASLEGDGDRGSISGEEAKTPRVGERHEEDLSHVLCQLFLTLLGAALAVV